MRPSDTQIALTRGWEGTIRNWYFDVVHVETGGCGHVRHAADRPGPPVPFSDETIDGWLQSDSAPVAHALDVLQASLPAPLAQHELDGYWDAGFNCGVGVFLGEVGRRLRAGDKSGAADALLAWCHAPAGIVNTGLLNRRKAERARILDPTAELSSEPHHEPGLRPVPPGDEIQAEAQAMWVGNQPDYGARDLTAVD